MTVKVERADMARASTTYLRAGYTVTVDELLHLLLIGSDNAAARVLARVSPYGTEGFIARMNEKARELGLEQTHYDDPSGLLSGNVSSAYDMARLIAYAAADERIGGLMRKSEFNFTPGQAQRARVEHQPARAQRRARRARREDRLHQQLGLLPGDAGARCRRRAGRWRWWCSARGRTPRASPRRKHLFNWVSSHARPSWPAPTARSTNAAPPSPHVRASVSPAR